MKKEIKERGKDKGEENTKAEERKKTGGKNEGD
jgi:hypothetical protein